MQPSRVRLKIADTEIQNSICIMMFQLMKLAMSIWETATVAVKLNAEMFSVRGERVYRCTSLMAESFVFFGPNCS